MARMTTSRDGENAPLEEKGTPPALAGLLEGRVAVVTGGAAGIGGGCSRRLAAAGATVVVNDIEPDLLAATVADIETAGAHAVAVPGDIRQPDTVRSLAAAAASVDVGRIDVLVNNVGDYRPNGRFLKTGPDEWNALYALNFAHVLACTRAMAPAMVERRSGSIVNVSTVEAFRGIPANAVYSAFNAAVNAFTRSLAVELGRDGGRHPPDTGGVDAAGSGPRHGPPLGPPRSLRPSRRLRRRGRLPGVRSGPFRHRPRRPRRRWHPGGVGLVPAQRRARLDQSSRLPLRAL
jgi:NAD(P)-dependent dehydrogenase (short-subunit alcohol dehydrogenase family)